jgi:hypothetical protein
MDSDGAIEFAKSYLRVKSRRNVPREVAERLLEVVYHYQSRSAAYLDTIIDLREKQGSD